jgi:vacuolar-type H+-ATPase subunit H
MGIRKKKTFIEQATDYVDQVRPHVEQALETAKEQAKPLLEDARDKAVPLLHDARDRAVPKIQDARDRARPVIADSAALAAEKAAHVAEVAAQKAAESRDLAAAKVSELKGEPPKKRGRFKKVMLLGVLAAAAAFVANKLKGRQESQSWQSTYQPSPPPTPATPPTPAAPGAGADAETDDPAGSSPDEALSDAVESPHPATTPDNPADEVVIDEGGSHKK